jgi:hypothetical protein
MSEQRPTAPSGTEESPTEESRRHRIPGYALFAAVMMVIVGIFQVISALAAILENHLYLALGDHLFGLDVATWGWIHLLIGLLVAAAGVLVYTGRLWGTTTGIIVAAVSAIENFMFLPYYAIWSLVIIALDVVVIWVLAIYGFRTTEPPRRATGFRQGGATAP